MSIFKDFADNFTSSFNNDMQKISNTVSVATEPFLDTSVSGITNNIFGLFDSDGISNVLNSFGSIVGYLSNKSNLSGTSYLGTSTVNSKYTDFAAPNVRNKNKALFSGKAKKYKTETEVIPRAIMEFSENWNLKLPDWGYDDFINERAMFQKQITTVFNDPAYFYFKVFFRFDTQNGLFGGLLNNENNEAKKSNRNGFMLSNNSASKYLYTCSASYYNERLGDRILALKKFTSLLSYICTNAPWFFSGIKGLDKISGVNFKNFSEEKAIELDITPDAIDMRLTTLMSLYKYACYDEINGKEIIPENIRKFDMTIVIFQTPIRYLHTSAYSEAHGKHIYKSLSGRSGSGEYSNMMSFKLYSFTGCEFDINSFASIIPSGVKNDRPFTTSETSIKITYTKCYEYTSNEFFGFLFGTDGFYYNQYSTFQQAVTFSETGKNVYNGYINKIDSQLTDQERRYSALQDSLKDYSTSAKPGYNKLIDASEYIIHGFYDMGDNIWYKNSIIDNVYDGSYELGNLYGNVGVGSPYWQSKINRLKRQKPHDYIIGGNNNLLGNRNKYTSDTTKSQYWEDKIEKIKTPYKHNYDLSKFKHKANLNSEKNNDVSNLTTKKRIY